MGKLYFYKLFHSEGAAMENAQLPLDSALEHGCLSYLFIMGKVCLWW